MKIKLTAYFLLAILVFVLSSLSNTSYTNTSGPPSGYTGSPFDGATCGSGGGCHFINPIAKAGWITSNVPGTGYVPAQVYTITAKVICPSRSKFGFEVSPQSVSGILQGTIILTNTTETKFASAKYITQTSLGCGGSGSRTWTFNWKAPLAGTGNVTFYGAFNATNANGSTSGDSVFTSTLVIAEDPNVSVNSIPGMEKQLLIFPNPSNGVFNVELPVAPSTPVIASIYDSSGKRIMECLVSLASTTFDLSDKPAGVYYLVIGTTYGSEVKKILVE